MPSAVAYQAYTETAMTLAAWAAEVSVWHRFALYSMLGYAGFLKLRVAKAFKSLRQHNRRCATVDG